MIVCQINKTKKAKKTNFVHYIEIVALDRVKLVY